MRAIHLGQSYSALRPDTLMQTSSHLEITLADEVGHTFFARNLVAAEVALERRHADPSALCGQPRLQLGQGDVGNFRQRRLD